MKYFAFILFLFFSLQLVYSQDPIEPKQFIIGIDNVSPNDVVDHTIGPIGTYWQLNFITQIWSISNDPLGESSTLTTIGESDFDEMGAWDGWNFFWLGNTAPENEDWALGFYKVTNNYNSEYFYIDCRVDDFGQGLGVYSPPDFFVYLDGDEGSYNIGRATPPPWTLIDNGEVVRIWDVHNTNPPNSNSLPDFWDNVLVSIDGGNNHPRIAWGPYPDNSYPIDGYKIYRAITTGSTPPSPGSFSLVATKNSTTYEWVDPSIDLGGINYAHYFVKAKFIPTKAPSFDSEESNIVTFSISLTKESVDDLNPGKGFTLKQNYPNPFNPATTIQFSIKNKSFASLKIYDILGNEVAVLIENFLEAGDHSIDFDASDLPSGIYMYRLQTDEISLTKKMILLQ